jgi:Holliday junction resolvasome RuvABC endonuclease subunit
MLVLGLDPSLTNYGWALHDTTATGQARCIDRGRYSTSSSTIFVDRYTFMRDTLRGLIVALRPDRVGIESPVFGEAFSSGMYGLFLYSNEALKLEHRDVVFFSPGQVKAHARESLGRPDKWKMQKPDMVAAVKHDLGGGKAINHNEADAYLVARLAGRFWAYLDGGIADTSLTGEERKLFAEVHTYQRGKKAGKTEKKGLIYREEDRFFRWSQIEESGGGGTAP